MSTVGIITAAALAVLGIGLVAVAWNLYRLLFVWAEDRAREKRLADEWQRQHRRQVGQ